MGGLVSRSRRLKIMLATIGPALGMLVAGWVMVLRVPNWYRPAGLSDARVDTVRGQLEQSFEMITQKLRSRQPVSITVDGDYINEVLAAGRRMWTAESGGRVHAPCVSIEPDLIRVGARSK